MSASSDRSPWDFGNLYDLVNSLTTQEPSVEDLPPSTEATPRSAFPLHSTSNKLGDLGPIWKFLDSGQPPVTLGSSTTMKSQDATVTNFHDSVASSSIAPVKNVTYNSDGGAHSLKSKTVKWDDEAEIVEASDEWSPPELPFTPSKSSKKGKELRMEAQKKAEKKASPRSQKKLAKLGAGKEKRTRSDVESESEIRIRQRPTPAKKASIHTLRGRPETPTPQSRDGTIAAALQLDGRNDTPKDGTASAAPATTSPSTLRSGKPFHVGAAKTAELLPASITPKAKALQKPQTLPPLPNYVQSLFLQQHLQQQVTNGQVYTPSPSAPLAVNPSSENEEPNRDKLKRQHAENSEQEGLHFQPNACPSGQLLDLPARAFSVAPPYIQTLFLQNFQIRDILTHSDSFRDAFSIRPKEDRELHLLLRLIHEFPNDKKWLTKSVYSVDHTSSPNGIHVFVDFSNIWICFMEHLKALQHKFNRPIPHQNISFDSLVLILERRRPVSKRVLAGSNGTLAAIGVAKAVGYETNILDKVNKSRELSEWQRKQPLHSFQRQTQHGQSMPTMSENVMVGGGMSSACGTYGAETCANPGMTTANISSSAGANSSAAMHLPQAFSEIATIPVGVTMPSTHSSAIPQAMPKKWVEQGVDEILHLKMLESIVDSDVPSTMVVATGDAAKAEYSDGFMKMIQRALMKGWMVEVVAWGKGINSAYRNHAFNQQWAGQFRVIELDDYAEYLLDT